MFEDMNLKLTDEIRRIRFLYKYWLLETEEKEPYFARMTLGDNFDDSIERTARVLLPYPKLLSAVNILLKYIEDNKDPL